VTDPRHGQGAAVRAALDAAVAAGSPGPYLVVNADLPCVTARDLLALAGAIPERGLALAPAVDGTTNALGFADERLFVPLYGPGSAERYAALGPSRLIEAPNLVDDVDTVDDLHRLAARLGPRTKCVLAALRDEAAA
jgi:2-phospho-L-lactate guanylyltransferase